MTWDTASHTVPHGEKTSLWPLGWGNVQYVCVCWGAGLEREGAGNGSVCPQPSSALCKGDWTLNWGEIMLQKSPRVEFHDLVCKGWVKGGCRKREVQEPGMNTLPCLLDCAVSSEGLGYSPTHVIKGSKAPCCALKGQWWSQLIYRFYTWGQFQVNAGIKTWVKCFLESFGLSPWLTWWATMP